VRKTDCTTDDSVLLIQRSTGGQHVFPAEAKCVLPQPMRTCAGRRGSSSARNLPGNHAYRGKGLYTLAGNRMVALEPKTKKDLVGEGEKELFESVAKLRWHVRRSFPNPCGG
jgi:hypothetical protein